MVKKIVDGNQSTGIGKSERNKLHHTSIMRKIQAVLLWSKFIMKRQ